MLMPIALSAYTSRVFTDKGIVTVQPVADGIIRIGSGSPAGLSDPTGIAVLDPQDINTHSWISPDEFVLTTGTTRVSVNRHTGKVSFYDTDGRLLLSEAMPLENAGDTGKASFIRPAGEFFYGTGERGHSLVYNDDSLSFYNRPNYGYGEGDSRISQMNISIPWIVSDAGYGILFDDYSKAGMQVGDTIRYVSGGTRPLAYYFINGDGNMADAVGDYSRLTGLQDMPPLWTLGYITSKYGYGNREETLGVVDTLRQRGYPLDGLVLDLYWYGVETDMGRLEWDGSKWPDHAGMLRTLRDKGVNTVVITQPYINKIGAIDNYNLLDSLGMLTHDAEGKTNDVTTWVGEAGMFDVTNPDTRVWMWNRLSPLVAEGLSGLWGDLGEPEQHPVSIVHSNGETAEQFHNNYGNSWSEIYYEGLRKDFPDMRPFLMMRGGTAGLQRYSVFPWTSDVSRSWEGLYPQIRLMLSSGLSGLGYMSSDIGGFAVDPEHPEDPELYVRWLQMGAFTPVLRTHAQQKPEPYHYQKYEDILKRYINMRYEWLPYNYTLAYQNASQGLPLARPLNFRGDNPGVKYIRDDEYLWGDDVLVAPVLKKGATGRKVLFPAGEWVDFFNPALRYKGGSEVMVKAPIEKLPLFVRTGAFIPLSEQKMENTSGYDPQNLTIRYYPSADETRYVLFDDDRKSPTSLQDNAFQLTTFVGRSTPQGTDIAISAKGAYDEMPPFRRLKFEIPGIPRPEKVDLSDGTAMPQFPSVKAIRQYGWTYNASTRTLTVIFPWAYSDTELQIR